MTKTHDLIKSCVEDSMLSEQLHIDKWDLPQKVIDVVNAAISVEG